MSQLSLWSRAVLALSLASVGVVAHAAPPPNVDGPIRLQGGGGRDAAIILGNEAYTSLPQATYAGVDARAVQDLLVSGLGLSKSRVVFDDNATTAQLLDGVKRGVTRVKKGGTLWIYYAGYGTVTGQQRALLGVEATPDTLDKASVPLDTVLAMAGKSAASRVIVIIDAGFGGDGRDGLPLVAGKAVAAAKGPPSGAANTTVWLSDTGRRTVVGFGDGRHGMFTWLVLGALRGWADGALTGTEKDGKVTLDEAQEYVIWTGCRMGRAMAPSEELRPEIRGWTLSQGTLERGPGPEALADLGAADRARRVASAEERLRAEASAFWQQTAAAAQKGGPEGQQQLQAFVDEYSTPIVNVEFSVFIPEVLEARKALKGYGSAPVAANTNANANPNPNPNPNPNANTAANTANNNGANIPPPPPPKNDIIISAPAMSCDDLVALEGPALMGQFTDDQVTCLQGRLATSRLQTSKNKISRMLLVNAQTKGDIAQWETLMKRHLEEIDRSDPNLCMLYAIHLHKKGVDYDDEAIYWSGYALENKEAWTGDEYVKRVNSLFKLRAEAANRLWQQSEETYRKEASDENDEATKEYRGLAKDFAREWLDYAKASGQEDKLAMELCRSAAGSDEFCRTK